MKIISGVCMSIPVPEGSALPEDKLGAARLTIPRGASGDYTEAQLAAIAAHPVLAPLFGAGCMTIALDGDDVDELRLAVEKATAERARQIQAAAEQRRARGEVMTPAEAKASAERRVQMAQRAGGR